MIRMLPEIGREAKSLCAVLYEFRWLHPHFLQVGGHGGLVAQEILPLVLPDRHEMSGQILCRRLFRCLFTLCGVLRFCAFSHSFIIQILLR